MQRRENFTVRNYMAAFVVAFAAFGPISAARADSGVQSHYLSGSQHAGYPAVGACPIVVPQDRHFAPISPAATDRHFADSYRLTAEIQMRRLVADALVYAIDNDGRFPDTAAGFTQSIAENDDTRIDMRSWGFRYNTNLAGVDRDNIRDAAHTVLVYEGLNEHMAYRHGGRAIVAFVDGHVELVGPHQAASLKWRP